MTVKNVSLHESNELIHNGAIVIDIREPDECDEFLPNTTFVPLSLIKEGLGHQFNPEDVVLFYCRSGRRSTVFAEHLDTFGASAAKLYAMEGGFTAWRNEGYPYEKSAKHTPVPNVLFPSIKT